MHTEVIETRGDYRAVIHVEEYPHAPDGDCQGAVIAFYRGQAHGQTPEGEEFAGIFREVWDRFDWPTIERYFRIFHGTRSFYTLDTRDSSYIFFDSAAMREKWGCPDEYAHESVKGTYEEWRAYLEGDVWWIAVERLEEVTTSRMFAGTPVSVDVSQEWDSLSESQCGGYYGEERAREAALEQLECYV